MSLKIYLFVCYFVQGLSLSYFLNFQKPLLAKAGLGLDQIANLSSIMLLPFVLKVIISYISDRFSFFGLGHRKPYLFLGIVFGFSGFFGASYLDPLTSYTQLFAALAVASFGLATLDAISDGLAVERFAEKESEQVQALLMMGRGTGLVTASLLFGNVATSTSSVFATLAFSFVLPFVVLLPAVTSSNSRIIKFEMGTSDKKNGLLLFAAFCVLHTVFTLGTESTLTLMLTKLKGFTADQIGSFAFSKGGFAILGALTVGLIAKKWHDSRYILVALITYLSVLVGTGLCWNLITPEHVSTLGIFWGIAGGLMETTFVTLAMRNSNTKRPATFFAIWMALANIGILAGTSIFTRLSGTLSPTVLLLLAAVFLGAAFYILLLSRRRFAQ